MFRAAYILCVAACLAVLACRGRGEAAAREATTETPATSVGTAGDSPAVRDTVPTVVRGICRAAGSVAHSRPSAGSTPVLPTQIAHAVESGPAQALRCVARTAAELERLREVVGIPDSVARSIDLSRGIVVAATMGMQPIAGYDIFVGRVRARGDTLWIGVHGIHPEGPVGLDMITAPVDVVVVPRRPRNVIFFDH